MNVNWAGFEAMIDAAAANWFKQPVIWQRQIANIHEFGEDGTPVTENINLECLAFYNEFRTWPITDYTDTGEIDKQSLVLMFNLNTLADLGYTNSEGSWDFKPEVDRFIFQGISLKCAGWTNLAQTSNKPLLVQLVFQREILSAGA